MNNLSTLALGFGAWLLAASPALAQPAIPNLAGKILTVNGPINPDRLGHTLMHEHIFIDFTLPEDAPEKWQLTRRKFPVGATEVEFYRAPLQMHMLGEAMLGKPNRDNYLLQDEELAIAELREFKRHGGGSVVDTTSIGLKRKPEALRRVSRATGLNIVMGSSWYTTAWHPDDMDRRRVEDLTAEIVRDVTVGVDGTKIRSGIIGEVGTAGNPLTENEIKIIRASGRASVLTGAAISLHTSAILKEQPRILDLLAAEGADLSRVILGHSNALANDLDYMLQLLARGAYIQFDVLGKPPRITLRRATDGDVARAIVELIKAGYGERILLSQDVCTKTHLKAYGGTGYSFIEETFLPHLKQLGLSDEQIDTLVVKNPQRVLTFVAPRQLPNRSEG